MFCHEGHIVCSLSYIDKTGIIFWGTSTTTHKVFLLQNGIVRIMTGKGVRRTCRNWFKKFDILMVQTLYIFSLMFVVNNPDNSQTNFSICCINMRHKNQVHIPLRKYSSIQKGFTFSSIKIFNTAPASIFLISKG